MFISASRSRKGGLAGLAVCSALMASTFAANAGASIIPPPPPPPPPGDAVLVKPTDLVVSATTLTTVRIKNTGDRSAGPFSIGLKSGYLIYQCDGFDRPIPAVRKDVSGLGPGRSTTVEIPWSSRARNVTVDYLNTVGESNELNNTGTVPGGGPIVC